MKIIPHYDTIGDIVNLKTSRKNHISDRVQTLSTTDNVTENFANLLTKSINKVNALELKSTDLTNQMAVNPDNVNIHDGPHVSATLNQLVRQGYRRPA